MSCPYCKQHVPDELHKPVCPLAEKRRRQSLRRKVAGISLQRSIGRRYVCMIAGKHVIFRAILRDSGSVRSWESVYSDWAHGPRNAGTLTHGLRDCVIATQHKIVKDIRHEKGIGREN
jgi:hypothetical protein